VETTATSVPPGGYEEPSDGGEIRVADQGFGLVRDEVTA
jgi:hypothetical protein